MSVHHFVNDGLMALFFLIVGLELKRELTVGELSSLRDAILPGRHPHRTVSPTASPSLRNSGWNMP